MIRVAIIEDDTVYAKKLQDYLSAYSQEYNVGIQTTVFGDGGKLIFQYKPVYDILLMDIEMPIMNGLEAAKNIRKVDNRVIIIFITNMAQFAIKGYEVDALDYVLKPINYFAFSLKITKAISSIRDSKQISILVPFEDGMKKLGSGEIIYIEIRDHWLYIFTKDNVYKMLGTLKEVKSKLEGQYFVYCNNCFLVNLRYVTYLKKDTVILSDKYELKISRPRRKDFKIAIMNFYGGGIR